MIVIFIGDVFGEPGRDALKATMDGIRNQYKPDFVIANAENSAGGKGVTFNTADEILKTGVDALTLGNHAWARKEVFNIIDSSMRIIRPANFPKGVPGKGRLIVEKNGKKLGLVNLIGRVYMDYQADDPFQIAEREISALKGQCSVILVDFHAEATSEKLALARVLDGKVSAVLGTHTHVQTADERVLRGGTAFITDVGMTGPTEGIIGVEANTIIKRFTTGLPAAFEPAKGQAMLNAVVMDVDDANGRTRTIQRINTIVPG